MTVARSGAESRRQSEPATVADLRERIAAALDEARARTLLLIEPLSDEDLSIQHDTLMSHGKVR